MFCRYALVLWFAYVQGAITRFHASGGGAHDLQPDASNVIEMDALDPRNQAVSSSYSIVETSGSSTGPNRVRYSKREYEPSGENSENRPVGGGGGGGGGGAKKRTSKFARDEDGAKGTDFSYESDLGTLLTDDRERPRHKPAGRPQKKERKPPRTSPNSVNEIVERSQPLREAASSKKAKTNGDLKNEGTYLRGSVGDGFDEGVEKEKHFDKEAGKKFVEAHKAEAGEKAQQGYKKEEGFDKSEEEKHGKSVKKEKVSEEKASKEAHVDQNKLQGKEYKGSEGEKGISLSKKGGHKKQKKTTGYRKSHHKDEFKKDEVFYDESHDGEERDEHIHENEKHAKEKEGSVKKASSDSGYHEGHLEKQGVQDKGEHHEEASGHKKEAGHEAHHKEDSEYAKKGGVKEGEKHGHSEGGSSGGGYSDHDFF